MSHAKKAQQQLDEKFQQAMLLMQEGKIKEAKDICTRILKTAPTHINALHFLGFIAHQEKNTDQAITLLKRTIALAPNNVDAYNHLGAAFGEAGDHHAAIVYFDKAITLKPDYVDAIANRGQAKLILKKYQEALDDYGLIIKLSPSNIDAYFKRAHLLFDTKQFLPALADYETIIKLQGDSALTHLYCGNVYFVLRQYNAALNQYNQAITLDVNLIEAWENRGLLLVRCQEYDKALENYQYILHQKDRKGNILSAIYTCAMYLLRWDLVPALEAEIKTAIANSNLIGFETFPLLGGLTISAPEQKSAGLMLANSRFVTADQASVTSQTNAVTQTDKLRIGYLSADFHEHATLRLMLGAIQMHDRSRFSIYAYSYGEADDSPEHKQLLQAVDHFVDLNAKDDISAAQQIADDGIHILVELKGYTSNSRLGIVALRPAPISVSWLAYPGTLGHPRLADYIIGDPIVTPLEHQAHFSETLALMPHSYQPNSQNKLSPKPLRSLHNLPEDAFVFCSFNQAFKFNPFMFDIWCRLLKAVPHSVLWLLAPLDSAQKRLHEEAQLRGIATERIIFAPRITQNEHVARLQCADLALDTYPCNSHTTGSDALWAGVPMVTLIGETFASRVGASLMSAVGLPELITHTALEYFNLAYQLATDTARFAALRTTLADQKLTAPLFNPTQFAKDLEKLYQMIWNNHQNGIKQAIIVPPQ